jgi:hypothetical protein
MVEHAKVYPRQPKLISAHEVSGSDRSEGNQGCLGTVLFFASWAAAGWLLSKTNLDRQIGGVVWFAPFLAAILVTSYIIHLMREARASEIAESRNAQARAAAEREAQQTTQMAQQCYAAAFQILKRLETDVWLAAEAIGRARQEFGANAFAPYWDLLEKAATHLGEFRIDIQSLASNVGEYESLLKGQAAYFPFLSDYLSPTPGSP